MHGAMASCVCIYGAMVSCIQIHITCAFYVGSSICAARVRPEHSEHLVYQDAACASGRTFFFQMLSDNKNLELSDVWVEGQSRPAEAAALSCVQKSSGGGGGNSPLVTRQAATGDI